MSIFIGNTNKGSIDFRVTRWNPSKLTLSNHIVKKKTIDTIYLTEMTHTEVETLANELLEWVKGCRFVKDEGTGKYLQKDYTLGDKETAIKFSSTTVGLLSFLEERARSKVNEPLTLTFD